MTLVRLQKHIADLGICSRRKAEGLITAGKVKVNGQTVATLGIKIDPEKDKVEVTETNIPTTKQNKSVLYILLNKPIDYTTNLDDKSDKNILNLLIAQNQAGRNKKTLNTKPTSITPLDADYEGLIILTDNEQFVEENYNNQEKEYEITVDHALTRDAKKVLNKGMIIDNEEFPGIEIVKEFNKGRITIITITIKQEKTKQLNKMFERLGYNVLSIKRTRIDTLKLGTLSSGQWMPIKNR